MRTLGFLEGYLLGVCSSGWPTYPPPISDDRRMEEQYLLRLVQYLPVWICLLHGLYEIMRQKTLPAKRH